MKQKRGFTLVEIIVVVALMAITAAVAVPTSVTAIKNAEKLACDERLDTVRQAYYQIYAETRLEMGNEAFHTAFNETYLKGRMYVKALNQVIGNCNQSLTNEEINNLMSFSGLTWTDASSCVYSIKKNGDELDCNRHGVSVNPNFALTKDPLQSFIQEINKLLPAANNNSFPIDNYGYNKPDTFSSKNKETIEKIFELSGFKSSNIKAWAFIPKIANGPSVIISSIDISTLKENDTVPVIRYDSKTGKFSVYKVTIQVNNYKVNNVTYSYNVLGTVNSGGNSFKGTEYLDYDNSAAGGITDYDTVREAYDKLYEELGYT